MELHARGAKVTPCVGDAGFVRVDANDGVAWARQELRQSRPVATADVEDVETPLALVSQPGQGGQDEASLLRVAEDVLPGQLRESRRASSLGAQRAFSIAYSARKRSSIRENTSP
jgi:hypothetical protein